MTELEQIKRISEKGCAGVSCSECILKHSCGNSGKLMAKSVIDLLSYDSDLSKCKAGDWIWVIEFEWVQIEEIEYIQQYPITLTNGNNLTIDGKYLDSSNFPSAFIKPPLCFNPGPKPEPTCKLKKMDKVLASNSSNGEKNYRYFAEYIPDNILSPYFCFVNGGDEWSSKGKTMGWECCEAYKGEIK